jgi:AcrR family transcriptional regulator
LGAARDLFTTKGYVATGVGEIAARAAVAVDTVYATVGRKPTLMREVVESAISGVDHAIPADDRSYVRRIEESSRAAEKISIYARAIAEMSPRTAPVFVALRDAAMHDADCAALLAEISDRRAANMRRYAASLRSTGDLRTAFDDDAIGDIVWATAGFEHYTQLVGERGWTAERFGNYLDETWRRLFLGGD